MDKLNSVKFSFFYFLHKEITKMMIFVTIWVKPNSWILNFWKKVLWYIISPSFENSFYNFFLHDLCLWLINRVSTIFLFFTTNDMWKSALHIYITRYYSNPFFWVLSFQLRIHELPVMGYRKMFPIFGGNIVLSLLTFFQFSLPW